jgi:hypothetical protein
MIGKCCVAAVLLFAGTAAAQTSTTLDVPIVVTHGALSSCANGPTISVDNPTPAAGSTINVTVACGPGNQKDYVQLTIYPNKEYVGRFVYLNGATNGTFQLPIPQVVQDRPASYVAVFNVNNTFNELAETTPMVVPPTISPPAPTSTLPSALAADPFVPDHTFTVCASGCNYTNLGEATDAAASLDNVLIKVSSGDYPFPQNYLGSSYPPHLWIKGVGATMPHFYGITNNGASIIGTHQAACASNATFTMDNLELGPWNYWTVKSTDCITFTMRNSYIHDTPQGMITGNTQHLTLNLYNDVFARHGSGNGPEHDIYVGEGDQTNIVNVKNSVFEQSFIGHAFKERAKTLNATCSMFIVNQDAVYLGSETLDAAYAGQINANYDLFATGDADQAWSSSDAWDTTRYGYEAGPAPFSYPNNSTPIFSNSIFLDDDPVTNHDFVSIAVPITPSAPVTWSGNKFVWASPQAYVPTDGGAIWFNNTSRWAHPGDIVLDNTNQIFTSRAAAGLPAVGTYPKGWRDFLPMMPTACIDPIGNVKIPTN